MSDRSILFISAEPGVAARVESVVRERFAEQLSLTRVHALFDGLRSLQDGSFDLILSDLFLPDGQGLATLHHLQQHVPNTPVIALCHSHDRETGVTAVRKGAYDFFCYEDLDPSTLEKSIEGALRQNHAALGKAAERRTNARFPCRLAVSYQTLEHPILSGQGTSETLNISSKGLLFTSQERFHEGQLVQVSLDWPARLENQIPLKLVAEGRIVRNSNGQTAMTIEKYEFRTRRVAQKRPEPAKEEKTLTTTNRPAEAVGSNGTRPGTAAGSQTNGASARRPV
ncbi:MAG TPA: response regulator [Bryobacteraceae bacterium]|nr:response regulator [Bryobacteraceae bacterium]